MTTSRRPRTVTDMTRGSALVSYSRRFLHFAAVRSASLFCLLVVCVLDLLCLAVLSIGSRCLRPSTLETRRNDLEVHTTSGDGGNVEMEPATAENANAAAESMDMAGTVRDVTESCTDVLPEIATAPGNVRDLIKKFEIVENAAGIGAAIDKPSESSAAVGYNGLDGSRRSSLADQPGAGVVGQLVKRFDGSEKIPVRDDKPSMEVINKSSTVIHLIDRFNCTATV